MKTQTENWPDVLEYDTIKDSGIPASERIVLAVGQSKTSNREMSLERVTIGWVIAGSAACIVKTERFVISSMIDGARHSTSYPSRGDAIARFHQIATIKLQGELANRGREQYAEWKK